MTAEEFNIKYKDYLEEGHYGLDIYKENVIEYLNTLFEETLIHIPKFQYAQIKEKFHMARFYTNLPDIVRQPLGFEMERTIENKITELLKIKSN